MFNFFHYQIVFKNITAKKKQTIWWQFYTAHEAFFISLNILISNTGQVPVLPLIAVAKQHVGRVLDVNITTRKWTPKSSGWPTHWRRKKSGMPSKSVALVRPTLSDSATSSTRWARATSSSSSYSWSMTACWTSSYATTNLPPTPFQ